MEAYTKGDIYAMAKKAAANYKKALEAESKLTNRPYFERAEECFRAGYEQALIHALGDC